MGISRLIASDEKRREVAERLRNASARRGDAPWMVEDLMLALGFRCYEDGEDQLFDRLADLIDRPTCELVEVWDDEAKQHYLDCTACHFGRLSIELDDVGMRFNSRALWASVDYTSLTHCPYCGADVER